MQLIKDIRVYENGRNGLSGKKHIHNDSYEILQVLEGNGVFMIGNRLFPLVKYAVFFIPQYEVHSVAPGEGSYVRNILNIDSNYLERFCELTDDTMINTLFQKQSVQTDAETAELLSKAFFLLKERGNSVEKQLHFIRILLMLSETGEKAPSVHNMISVAIKYIDEHLNEKLTVEEICEQVPLSRFYFCRLFRKNTGMSPVEYITQRRVSTAKKMILNTDMSISEIAEHVGFGSFSNFSNRFRQTEGVSPREFRKRNCN